jgi:hypothetical protein
MSQLLALPATLKAILIVAAVTFATSDRLPVILISLFFNLAQLGGKSSGERMLRHGMVVSRSHDQ